LTENEPRIFLCHASDDKARVRELYHQLEAAGYHPWLDEEDLLPGQSWWAEIKKVITDPYNLVVVCLSSNSITKRGVVQREIKRALDVLEETPEGTIYLIPARLEDFGLTSSSLVALKNLRVLWILKSVDDRLQMKRRLSRPNASGIGCRYWP
jgi:hypothetical protein